MHLCTLLSRASPKLTYPECLAPQVTTHSGHWYWERFGMVSETGITFLIVLCVCFSLDCTQFLTLYFWDVQKQLPLSRYIPHSHWQVHPENCIMKKLSCYRDQARLCAACYCFQHCRHWAQCLCTWACLSWKRQGELAVKDKQCHTSAGHSHSGVCGAASLWVRDCCWVAVKAEDWLYQLSMLRLFYSYF